MRRLHNAPGSDSAQSALQAIAGWTPSRRSLLTMLAVPAAAAVTALPVAAAITDTVPTPALWSRDLSRPGCPS
jgi:hypothetical protein